ncbi:MAG: polysaccharide deacetylase family protein [Thermoleophilaceae bacterium]|nr:polysaccharide deacetylase family protein [Thermoleophilaceae bacterium]
MQHDLDIRRRRATAGLILLAVLALLIGALGGHVASAPSTVPPVGASTRDARLYARAAKTLARSAATTVTPAQQRIAVGRLVRSGKPLFCGGAKPYVALTFDDGPTQTTPQLVRLLKHAGVSATFFVMGQRLDARPTTVAPMQSVGYIANHSWSHPPFTTLTPAQMRSEIHSTQGAIEATDTASWRLFRPPYGDRNAKVSAVVQRERFAEVLWSADTEDALGDPWQRVASYATEGIGPGAIVLMHDGRQSTLTALRRKILPAIKRRKLQFVTLPEMLALNPPSAEQLAAGPRGCAQAGTRNVTGLFFKRSEQLNYKP